MNLTKEACQEESLESDPQDPSAGPSPQHTSRGTTGDPDPERETESISDTPSPFTIPGPRTGVYLGHYHFHAG